MLLPVSHKILVRDFVVKVTDFARPMNDKTEIKKSQPDKISSSLNPRSEHFDFELWARKVRQQMMAALEEKSRSSEEIITK